MSKKKNTKIETTSGCKKKNQRKHFPCCNKETEQYNRKYQGTHPMVVNTQLKAHDMLISNMQVHMIETEREILSFHSCHKTRSMRVCTANFKNLNTSPCGFVIKWPENLV